MAQPDSVDKPTKIRAEVAEMPTVRRGKDDEVTSIEFLAKVPFKGIVTIKARGDVATAYWSVTPGMKLALTVREVSSKEFLADSITLVGETGKG